MSAADLKPRIIVVGSANTDYVVQVAEIPTKGQTVLGDNFTTARGGKGANQAVAAARLGAEVIFVARLGDDSNGKEALAAYRQEGICTDTIARDPHIPSGVALILVSQTGENLIAVAPGANHRLSPADVMAAEAAFPQADSLLLQLEIPLETVKVALELARRHGLRTILNPAPAHPLPAELLSLVDILTPNESECALLAGLNSGEKIKDYTAVARRLGVPCLVVTLGSHGAMLVMGGKQVHVPAFPITPVDTTAAGDAFNAALTVAIARGLDLEAAVRFANGAGALAATRLGAQPSLPTSQELEQFLAQHIHSEQISRNGLSIG